MTDLEVSDSAGARARTIEGAWDGVGLPMPRNPALLDPATPRLRVRTVGDLRGFVRQKLSAQPPAASRA